MTGDKVVCDLLLPIDSLFWMGRGKFQIDREFNKNSHQIKILFLRGLELSVHDKLYLQESDIMLKFSLTNVNFSTF